MCLNPSTCVFSIFGVVPHVCGVVSAAKVLSVVYDNRSEHILWVVLLVLFFRHVGSQVQLFWKIDVAVDFLLSINVRISRAL